MGRIKRLTERLVPSKVFYLWERFNLKRIELFTQEDLAKKPEISQDINKLPVIPTNSKKSFAAMHQQKLDEEERRRRHHGKGH